MQFILGYLALVQIVFLPGFIILELLNFKEIKFKIPLVFATSLLFNYILVMGLILLGFYDQIVLLSLFGIEVVGAIWIILSKDKITQWVNQITFMRKNITELEQLFASQNNKISNLKFILAIISFSILVWFLLAIPANFIDIFHEWDVLRSWNEWAVRLFESNLIFHSWNYPMLIPANWSLTYIFMDSSQLTYAASSLDRIFVFMLFLVTVQWGWLCYRSVGLLVSPILLLFLFTFFSTTGNIATSLVDIPVAFLGTLALAQIDYSFLKSKQVGSSKCNLEICAVFIAIAGASLTKQAGLALLVSSPIILILISRQSNFEIFPAKAKIVFYCWLSAVLVVIPWYVYARYQISIGLNSSEIKWVTSGIYGSVGVAERFGNWIVSLSPVSLPGLSIIGIGSLALLSKSRLSIITGFCLLFILLWAIFLSYDGRNAMLAVPGMAIAASFVLKVGLNLGVKKIKFEGFQNSVFKKHIGKLIIMSILIPSIIWVMNSKSLLSRIDTYMLRHHQMDRDLILVEHVYQSIIIDLQKLNPGKKFTIYTEEKNICPYVKFPDMCTDNFVEWSQNDDQKVPVMVLYKNSNKSVKIDESFDLFEPRFERINDKFKIYISKVPKK